MPATGLYFLPSTPSSSNLLSTTLDRLTKTVNATPLARWSLEHRLFRSAPSSVTPSASQASNGSQPQEATRYLHLLTLPPSSPPPVAQPKSYVLITPPMPPSSASQASSTSANPAAGTVIAIPTAQSEEFNSLLTSKFGPLWTPRQTLAVAGGSAFELQGGVVVGVGEVRAAAAAGTGGGMGAVGSVKGVVVEVRVAGSATRSEGGNEDEGEADTEYGGENEWGFGEELIRGLWENLGLKGGREYLRVPGLTGTDGETDLARQWCELLRLRA